MNNIKKTVSCFLVSGLLASSGFFAVNTSFQNSIQPVRAESQGQSSAQKPQVKAEDFSGEVDANSEEIVASISQSTLTDTSQSLSVTFRSKTVLGYRTAIGNYIVQLDDANFGDEDNPAPADYERVDPETGFPIFDGFIAFVLGGSGRNGNVFLPSTLTRKKEGANFIVNITKIAKNAITATGSEYNDRNNWNSIKNIYIPNTITTVEAGAFTGYPGTGIGESDPIIHYEGTALPAGFATGWTDAPEAALDLSSTSYTNKASKAANVGGKVTDIPDEYGRPVNFVLGMHEDVNNPKFNDPKYNKPLVIQYDRVVKENGVEKSRTTLYEELPVLNENGPYDSIGEISSLNLARQINFDLGKDETIDPESVVFHNIFEAGKSGSQFAVDL